MLLFIPGNLARAQDVILHLRNGDRIAGSILSESTNEVKLSTVWSKEVAIPASQIERRETVPVKTHAEGKTVPATNIVAVAVSKPATEAASTKTRPWYKSWKGDVSIGTDFERGASDHELYFGKVNLTYSHPYLRNPKEFFRNIFGYTVDYGKTDGVLSANDMGGSSKTDFDVGRKVYVYNLGEANYDQIRKIDVHYEEGPGVGYHLLTGTNLVLNTEFGVNYQVEDRSDHTTSQNFYYRFGEDLTWKLNKQLNLTEKFEFFPRVEDVEQYRLRFESTLSYALILNFSLNLTAIDLYDTRPATGIPPNELEFRTTLGVKF